MISEMLIFKCLPNQINTSIFWTFYSPLYRKPEKTCLCHTQQRCRSACALTGRKPRRQTFSWRGSDRNWLPDYEILYETLGSYCQYSRQEGNWLCVYQLAWFSLEYCQYSSKKETDCVSINWLDSVSSIASIQARRKLIVCLSTGLVQSRVLPVFKARRKLILCLSSGLVQARVLPVFKARRKLILCPSSVLVQSRVLPVFKARRKLILCLSSINCLCSVSSIASIQGKKETDFVSIICLGSVSSINFTEK